MQNQQDKVIIANMSGFYGDRFSAAREMVEGGPIDYLTGDYLAELTMAILYKAQSKRPENYCCAQCYKHLLVSLFCSKLENKLNSVCVCVCVCVCAYVCVR